MRHRLGTMPQLAQRAPLGVQRLAQPPALRRCVVAGRLQVGVGCKLGFRSGCRLGLGSGLA